MDLRTELFTSRLEDRYKKRVHGKEIIFNQLNANTIAHHLGKGNELPSPIKSGNP